ncbi:c-type cytochrome [Sphingomonas cavernae]|uniref:Cytochrome c family protein n=1 Tax=Sphingomonas cavernae TaxID=2320861 RepID=A0A418WNZ6_9SPHN|nr:c-type cytochrome [Sphingomonas cavernae]RJF92956.1 cytochrome c family protein [Sphingomonas cavernae]
MRKRHFLTSAFLLGSVMLVLGQTSAAAPADGAGMALFKQRCQNCHSLKPGAPAPLGPNLAGVVGRRAGSTDFRYSPALKSSGLVWNPANLDRYLASPTKAVPGTRMVISVPDAKQRGELIRYLGDTAQ